MFVVGWVCVLLFFFFSSRRRHTRLVSDWSSDVCSSDLPRTEHLVGVCATAVALAALAIVAVATLARLINPRWWWVILSLLLVAVLAGKVYRDMTLRIIGASFIGLDYFSCGPIAIVLLYFAARYALRLRRRPP